MNSADFRRNFTQSYFGIKPSFVRQYVSEGFTSSFKDTDWLPCTGPLISDGDLRFQMLVKLDGMGIEVIPVRLPWQDDMDENTDIMQCQHPLVLGMVQAADTCVFLRRYPKRDYHRGYNPRACTVWVPNLYALKDGHPLSANSRHIVWSVYNPHYPLWDDAVTMLSSGDKLGIPLAPWLGIFLDAGKKYPRIAYRTEVVGFIADNEPVVYADSPEVCLDYIHKITGKTARIK